MNYRLALLACLAASALAPRPARATELAQASAYETPPRKGFYVEFAGRPGAAVLRDGLVPMFRTHWTIGAGLTDRFKLGLAMSIGAYLESVKKPALGLDTMATGYVWRGLYLRGGAGLVSAVPLRSTSGESRPAFGGQLGVGYEWTIKKGAGIGLGADLDLRATSDRQLIRSFVLGLHFVFH